MNSLLKVLPEFLVSFKTIFCTLLVLVKNHVFLFLFDFLEELLSFWLDEEERLWVLLFFYSFKKIRFRNLKIKNKILENKIKTLD